MKKQFHKKKPKTIVFDEDARREFVTGFHKRKVARQKRAAEEFEEQLKEAKKKIREKARQTYKKIITPLDSIPDAVAAKQIEYELPEHTVKVRELLAEDIAEQNNWIGQNRPVADMEGEDGGSNTQPHDDDDIVPGMSITSLKQVKKIVNNQSSRLMRNEDVFRKKNKLERLKNRKKAARKRNLLKREKKKLKGRKRK